MAVSAPRDANNVPVLMGTSSSDGSTPVTLYADPTTHRLLTQSSGGGAPSDATFVTLSVNATLTNERVLTGTANQVTITDNGAGSTVVLSLPQSIATSSTPTFASMTLTAASSLTLGTASTNTGAIIFKNSSNANNTVLQAGAAGAALTFTLPTTDGANGEVLTTDGNGVMSWTAVAGGGANTALSNLASVALNTALLPDAAAADDFGSATLPFKDIFLAGSSGTPATNNFRLTGESTSGTRVITLPDATGTVALTSDIPAAGANTALSNLSSVAINTTLLPGSNDGAGLGSGTFSFSDLFLASGGVVNFDNGDMTITHSANTLTVAGGTIALGVATATTLNGLTVTSSTGTLTVTNGKTLSVSNTLTLAGTDSTTMTFPTTSASIARTDAGQTFTGVQAMTSPDITTSLTTPSTTFSLVNATATTVNFAGAATTLNMAGGSGAAINLGGGANAAELRFLEPSGSGTNYSAFKAQAQGADITYTLPASSASGVLTNDGSGGLSWAAASSGPSVTTSTSFETSARFSITDTGGSSTFGTNGVVQNTTSTANRCTQLLFNVVAGGASNGDLFNGNPKISFRSFLSTAPSSDNPEWYGGIGTITVAGGGHTFTQNHIGFKIVRVSGSVNLYGTVANGTTESTTTLATGLASDTQIDMYASVVSGTSATFYYATNGGSWSAGATISTNMPTATTDTNAMQLSVSNANVATTINVSTQSMSYTR